MRRVNPIGHPFIELGEVDSSNNYAMRQIQAQLSDHGTTYFADFQTQGKGQRGKIWNAEPGQNIMMSCVLKPFFLTIDNQFALNVSIALACCDFFNFHSAGNTRIKWPNDIYWEDRKAGGILIENVLQGKDWKFSVAGIGININQTFFSPDIANPVSLKQIAGKNFDPVSLAKQLCTFLQHRWEMLAKGNDYSWIDEYNGNLYKKGEKVIFKKNNTVFPAIIKGVNLRGELMIDTGTDISAIPFGEVEWMIR